MLLFNPKCRWRSAHPVADPRAGSRPPLAPAYSRSAGPSPGRQNRPGGPYNLSLFSVTGFLALFIPLFQQICDHQKNGRFPGGAGNFRIPANSPERFIRKPRRLRGQLTIYLYSYILRSCRIAPWPRKTARHTVDMFVQIGRNSLPKRIGHKLYAVPACGPSTRHLRWD